MSEPIKIKEYRAGDLTVVWKPSLCIHSEKCWRNLPAVFRPKSKPWIQPEEGEPDAIMDQIKKCPSGALGYVTKDGKEEETVKLETVIEQIPNGPLLVFGKLKLKNSEGEQVLENKTTAFCRCGKSSNKPFCDGTHVKTGFEG